MSQGDSYAGIDRDARLQRFFAELNRDTMHLVDAFYDEQVHFRDPIVEIRGRQAMRRYYAGLYANVTAIRFEFSEIMTTDDDVAAVWTMRLNASGLNGGKTVVVPGISHFRFGSGDQVVYHRDYFDMGPFIYEHVPVLKQIVRFVKSRLKH